MKGEICDPRTNNRGSRERAIDVDRKRPYSGVVYVDHLEKRANGHLRRSGDRNKVLSGVAAVGIKVTAEVKRNRASGVDRHDVLPLAALPVDEEDSPRSGCGRQAKTELDGKVDCADIYCWDTQEAGLADLNKKTLSCEHECDVGAIDQSRAAVVERDAIERVKEWPIAEDSPGSDSLVR